MAENGKGVGSAEGNPGEPGGAGMRGGSQEAVAMVQAVGRGLGRRGAGGREKKEGSERDV